MTNKIGFTINPQLKNLIDSILRWNSIYQKEVVKESESKVGKKKGPNKRKPKKKLIPKYEYMSKEELIERLRINDIFIDEISKSTRDRFQYTVVLKLKNTSKYAKS